MDILIIKMQPNKIWHLDNLTPKHLNTPYN